MLIFRSFSTGSGGGYEVSERRFTIEGIKRDSTERMEQGIRGKPMGLFILQP